MKTLRPVMVRLLLLLLTLQPAAVFAAQDCHDNGGNTGDHAHHAGMQHDQAPVVPEHAETLQCDCDCYCVGGCAQVCNAGAVPVTTTSSAISADPLLYGVNSFLLNAHPEPHLRPPNHT